MLLIRDIDTFRSPPSVLTIGNFDGVHKGHQRLFDILRGRAHDLGALATVVTFEPHTRAVVRPGAPLHLLTQLPEKLELFAEAGLDQAAVAPFTAETARLDAQRFLTWLTASFPILELWEGENFALGHARTGNLGVLAEIGRELGFAVRVFPHQRAGGKVISSTEIREALAAGEVREAAEMLGRPYTVPGIVIPGAHRGRELGFPTANLDPPPNQAIPADGVYATLVRRADGEPLPSITSIGNRPTFGPGERLLEVYILDFDGDLYGERLLVDFVEYLRPQVAYSGVEPLIAQMQEDLARTRAVLAVPG
ncbi:MAG: bifunctional riboflavin kinase/FAD synthetase [Chloroflexia bacterium]